MPNPTIDPQKRLRSLDAYRGFVMLAMASHGFHLSGVCENEEVKGHFQGTSLDSAWQWLCSQLAFHTSHVEWVGCSLWDMIQPSFMFLVGVALPYSIASRSGQNGTGATRGWHALFRALVLVGLGIFLRSHGQLVTRFTFEDVLTQIGLGYFFVYMLVGQPLWLQTLAVASIIGGDFWLFYQHPIPSELVEVGYQAHWAKGTNYAAHLDTWFLNLFPPENWYQGNAGGYQTLNFLPSMINMIVGVMCGEMLRSRIPEGEKCTTLIMFGAICLLLGGAADSSVWPFFAREDWVLCPLVKKIWTPSWALYSSGWTMLILAMFYYVIDVRGYRAWSFPLIVVGVNSIAIYCMDKLMRNLVLDSSKTHLGETVRWALTEAPYRQPLTDLVSLLGLWLVCLWMYRQRIFVRI